MLSECSREHRWMCGRKAQEEKFMAGAFSMHRWADWLVSNATDFDNGEQRWLAIFMYRQLLQGRQMIESARTTGDTLPQFTQRMPREGGMDFLR